VFDYQSWTWFLEFQSNNLSEFLKVEYIQPMSITAALWLV